MPPSGHCVRTGQCVCVCVCKQGSTKQQQLARYVTLITECFYLDQQGKPVSSIPFFPSNFLELHCVGFSQLDKMYICDPI